MERDNLITQKIADLKAKLDDINVAIGLIPTYKTNLIVADTNCRAITNAADMFKPWKLIKQEHELIEEFIDTFGQSSLRSKNVFGYTYDDWMTDIHNRIKEINLTNKKQEIEDAIKKLNRFYSEDKRATDSFNELLNSIDMI